MFPGPTDEHELITRWKNGDEKAFDQLFKLHFYKLNQFAIRHTNNPELSEELVMDIMLKVWQKKDLLQSDSKSLSYFLIHTLKAAIIDNYRKKRMEFAAMDDINEEPEYAVKADDRLLGIELNALYQNSLTLLSPQKRLVMHMRQERGMSYQEIADELNISAKTVDGYLCESVALIRKTLKKHIAVALLACTFFIR